MLKTDRLRRQAIHRFAPEANRGRRSRKPDSETNLLVCTDADGVGLNMQDADVIINYDLPMSADQLYQRAGRILRMSARRDRVVDIYTFIPQVEPSDTRAARAIQEIVSQLDHRQRRTATLLGGCLLPPPDDEADCPTEIPLATAEDIDRIPDWFNPPEDSLRAGPVSVISHRSVYSQNEARAASLPQVLMSAKTTSLPEAHVFLLLEIEREVHATLYHPASGSFKEATRDWILELLSCDEQEEKARVPASEVERAAVEATNAWLTKSGSTPEQIAATRLCTVYLEPVAKGRKAVQKVDGILKDLVDPVRNGG